MQKKLMVVGNWKCNNSLPQTKSIVEAIVDQATFDEKFMEVVVAPVFLHLVTVLFTKKNRPVQIAAQNCSRHTFGSYTGQISVEQLKDIGVSWVIIGQAQRRMLYKETQQDIVEKIDIALKNNMKVIYCFGETKQQKQQGKTKEVIFQYLDQIIGLVQNWDNIVLVYEPIWALNDEKPPSLMPVADAMGKVKEHLSKKIGKDNTERVRVLYGGYVDEKNCKNLLQLKSIDGFMMGENSLTQSFIQIVKMLEGRK